MIACPRCGLDTTVAETRRTGPGQARRRRVCKGVVCAHKFTTIELPIDGETKQHMRGIVATIARRDLEEISRLVTNALRQEGTITT